MSIVSGTVNTYQGGMLCNELIYAQFPQPLGRQLWRNAALGYGDSSTVNTCGATPAIYVGGENIAGNAAGAVRSNTGNFWLWGTTDGLLTGPEELAMYTAFQTCLAALGRIP